MAGLVIVLLIVVSVLVGYILYAKNARNGLFNQISALTKEEDQLQEKIQRDKRTVSQLSTQNQKFKEENSILVERRESLQEECNRIVEQREKFSRMLNEELADKKKITDWGYEKYCEVLDADYVDKEKHYDTLCALLENAYSHKQDELIESLEKQKEQCAAELGQLRKELEKIRQTKVAAMEAQLREQAIKEQAAFYSLQISELELADIALLETIRPRLNKPRVLSMLIWSTFYQKPMTALCNNILGTSIKRGIYKITNQKTGMCYIGQAVDIAARWKDHAKCGLGIDTPVGNKLYRAMLEDGLQNFTWELLEECAIAEFNEKEKYYIEMYDAYNFGYNSTKGNK